MTYYNQEIIKKEELGGGLIKILVLSEGGAVVEYHVTQEELDNTN